ncbi:MAG: hypothetical protein KJ795_09455 [Gammaproteobacteria bacterium]|nr:hypothetical protein [Gammaproteobacteria bacterium]MBU1967994.1 hypothetical protein [Gammaproteobacteria bacterium]
MMELTDWTGLSGLALVWMLMSLRLPVAARYAGWRRVLFVVAVYGAVMLPVFGLSLAGVLRGMVGDLSITSVMLLGMALYRRLMRTSVPAQSPGHDRYALLLFLAALALLLYPFALGLGYVDPYRSGYDSIALILMLSALALWAALRKLVLLPLAVALALSAWSLGWYESTNLWDYLIDAPLALYALGAVIKILLLNRKTGRGNVRADPQ